jgi:hypothetical protein
MNNKWSKNEINILLNNCKIMTLKELTILLPNRSYRGISCKIGKISSKTNEKWSIKEQELLKIVYNNISEILLDYFPNRKWNSIFYMLNKLKLKRNLNIKVLKNKKCEQIWKEDEIEELKNINNTTTNENLAIKFDTSIWCILKIQKKYNLKKDHTNSNLITVKNNKNRGRDLTYDNLKLIASKYKSRGEFQRYDNSAYSTSLVNGWLNDITLHMFPQNYSIPQLICKLLFDQILGMEGIYNTRQIIKPYELDIYYPQYKLGIIKFNK